jgi:hypothetical protein
MELLDPPVGGVGDEDVAGGGGNRDPSAELGACSELSASGASCAGGSGLAGVAVGRHADLELVHRLGDVVAGTRLHDVPAPRAHEGAVCIEPLHAAVVPVAHVDRAVGLVDRDSLRPVELASRGPRSSELGLEGVRRLGVEALDAVVAVVDDVDVGGGGRAVVDRNVTRCLELAVATAPLPEKGLDALPGHGKRNAQRQQERARDRQHQRQLPPLSRCPAPQRPTVAHQASSPSRTLGFPKSGGIVNKPFYICKPGTTGRLPNADGLGPNRAEAVRIGRWRVRLRSVHFAAQNVVEVAEALERSRG